MSRADRHRAIGIACEEEVSEARRRCRRRGTDFPRVDELVAAFPRVDAGFPCIALTAAASPGRSWLVGEVARD